MIDCRQVCEALEVAYLDGPEPNLSDEVRAHLDHCSKCQSESVELQDTWLLMPAALETPTVSPELEAAVMRRIAGAGTTTPASLDQQESRGGFWKYALAASVFLALTFSILWSRQARDSVEMEVADAEQHRIQELAEQMQTLQELEKTFGRAQLQFASLQPVGEDSNLHGALVYDYKAGEGHFFGFNFDAVSGETYKLWLLDEKQNAISSSVVQIEAEALRGSAIVKFPSDTSAMREVLVTLEKDETATTPSDNVQLRSPVQPEPL